MVEPLDQHPASPEEPPPGGGVTKGDCSPRDGRPCGPFRGSRALRMRDIFNAMKGLPYVEEACAARRLEARTALLQAAGLLRGESARQLAQGLLVALVRDLGKIP
jgi:hypothetical protein